MSSDGCKGGDVWARNKQKNKTKRHTDGHAGHNLSKDVGGEIG